MIEFLTLGGTCGDGFGSYQGGLFHWPDGSSRGVEDLRDLTVTSGPVVPSRRYGIARGLRDALTATGPLPRPLGFAASAMGLGLELLGGDGRSEFDLELRFMDGAVALIRTEAAGAERMEADREMVRLALLRRAAARIPAEAAPEDPEPTRPDGRDLASIFTYEKRGGRLRRLAAKALDVPDPEGPDETAGPDVARALETPKR